MSTRIICNKVFIWNDSFGQDGYDPHPGEKRTKDETFKDERVTTAVFKDPEDTRPALYLWSAKYYSPGFQTTGWEAEFAVISADGRVLVNNCTLSTQGMSAGSKVTKKVGGFTIVVWAEQHAASQPEFTFHYEIS